MSYYKKNYGKPKPDPTETPEQASFEEKAFAQLGGSIAFVLKDRLILKPEKKP